MGGSVGFLHTPTFPTQKMAVIIIVSGFGVQRHCLNKRPGKFATQFQVRIWYKHY